MTPAWLASGSLAGKDHRIFVAQRVEQSRDAFRRIL